MIDWSTYDKRRDKIDAKRRLIEDGIKERGAEEFLKAFFLQPPKENPPETEQWVAEWAIAFTEYFEKHPDQWEGIKSSNLDPPKVKDWKEKFKP